MSYVPARRKTAKPLIDKEIVGWPNGYMSIGTDGVIPEDALGDMTNIDLSQQSLPFIRRALTPYGAAFLGTPIGIGTFNKTLTGGKQEHYEISMQVVDGDAKLYTRKDGGLWILVTGSYTYDTAAWVNFCQSNGRVYITNGSNKLSYYDIVTGTIVVYTALTAPTTPTVGEANLTGTIYTYYYVVTANNEAGETDPSSEGSVQVSALRESWDNTTPQTVTVSWSPVTDADSYNIYVGTVPGKESLLATVQGSATTYVDDGRSVAAITKRPPLTNSTDGPVLTYLINIIGQLFGWGDVNNPSFVWYDGGGEGIQGSGNFTISGGGGYIAIDDGGPSIPAAVTSYRTGKGDPVPTVICNAAGGGGGVRHIEFTAESIGDLSALMPSVTEANGNVGTIAPLAVVSAGDSIHFPTGLGFMFEGSAPNIPNILSANSSSDFIQPDVSKLSLDAMPNARGIFYEGRVYFSLPVISSTNNQIWILDLKSNPARWIMPWTIPAQHMWLYQDNSGTTHFCLLVNGREVEFTPTSFTSDDGVPFSTRLASGPLRSDKAGIAISYIQNQRFRLLNARGNITMNVYGTGGNDAVEETENLNQPVSVPNTGWDEANWDVSEFDEDPGSTFTARPTNQTIPVSIKEKVSELTWDIVTSTAGCGYTLAATHTQGILIPKQYSGD